jgi:hypothetical protein
MEVVNNVLDFLNSGAGITTATLALELILRLVKTEKPKSLLIAASGILKMGIAVAVKLDSFLDKLVPQQLK